MDHPSPKRSNFNFPFRSAYTHTITKAPLPAMEKCIVPPTIVVVVRCRVAKTDIPISLAPFHDPTAIDDDDDEDDDQEQEGEG